MFIKALIVVLLGTSLVLATPFRKKVAAEHQEKFGDLVENGKEKSTEFDKEFDELKAKVEMKENKHELYQRLEVLKVSDPKVYKQLKKHARDILALQKLKMESAINNVIEKTYDQREIQNEALQKGIQYKQYGLL